MLKRVVSLLLAAVLLLGLGAPAFAADVDEVAPDWITNGTSSGDFKDDDKEQDKEEEKEDEEEREQTADTPSGVTLVTDRHVAYASGSGDKFGPNDYITRAAAAQMLLRLLPERYPITAHYSDVPADAWYAEAAGVLGSLWVIRPGLPTFLPDQQITRAEFISYIADFFPARTDAVQFLDVPAHYWAAEEILTARAYGWVEGFSDGTCGPDQLITRAQAVSILNRALGRSADRQYVDAAAPVCFYRDVPLDSWAYYDIVEASVPHEHSDLYGTEHWTHHTANYAGLSEGCHMLDGWTYYFSAAQHDFVRSGSVGGLTFGPDGRFTSGSAELDEKLHAIVQEHTNGGMTREQKLRALYLYTRDSFSYRRRPAYEFGATGWMQQDALNMLNTGYGNCYCYAALFWYLSRWIGYDAKVYSGTVGVRRSPHAWVEIDLDGKTYIFDTELEMAYRKKGRYDVDLYKYIDVDGWQYRKP